MTKENRPQSEMIAEELADAIKSNNDEQLKTAIFSGLALLMRCLERQTNALESIADIMEVQIRGAFLNSGDFFKRRKK